MDEKLILAFKYAIDTDVESMYTFCTVNYTKQKVYFLLQTKSFKILLVIWLSDFEIFYISKFQLI